MNRRYTIGPARPDQLSSLAAIERAAAALFPDSLIPPGERQGVVPLSALKEACQHGRLWVAEQMDGQAVGFVMALCEEDMAFLLEVDVHPDHQGQGLGRQLIQRVLDWASAQGFTELSLTTFANLPWNAPFYERLGFRRIDKNRLSLTLSRILAEEEARGLKDRVAMAINLHA